MTNKTEATDYLCLKSSPMQIGLYFTSVVFLVIGSVFMLLIFLLNSLFIAFFCKSRRAKQSPLCIYFFFIAITNIGRMIEFYLLFLAKLFPDKVFCEFIYFLPNFTGHLSIYILLLIQLQRLIVLRNKKLSLLLYNSALTYMICTSLVLLFIIFDEFYLYDNFFVEDAIYCPLTLMFTCITNRNFKLLHELPFDNLIYHHFQTVVHNILPVIIIVGINIAIKLTMNERKRRERQRRAINTKSNRTPKSQDVSRYATCSINERKRTVQVTVPLEEGLFFTIDEINFKWLLIPFIHVLLAIPSNLLSYMAEWNTDIFERVKFLKLYVLHYQKNGENTVHAKFPYIPNRIIGDTNVHTQYLIQMLYILSGLIDISNFSFFLASQLLSCQSVFREFKVFCYEILGLNVRFANGELNSQVNRREGRNENEHMGSSIE